MKTIHYAFASINYHKKTTLFIGFSFLLFLTALTAILNIVTIEDGFFKQLLHLKQSNGSFTNHFSSVLTTVYIGVLLLYFIFIITTCLIYFKKKQSEIVKWRLMGFSTSYITKLLLVEVFIPTFIAFIVAVLFVVLFQHTYNFILLSLHQKLSSAFGFLGSSPASLNANIIVESVPANSQALTLSSEKVRLFSIGIDKLPLDQIILAITRSYFILVSFLIITISFLTPRFTTGSKRRKGT